MAKTKPSVATLKMNCEKLMVQEKICFLIVETTDISYPVEAYGVPKTELKCCRGEKWIAFIIPNENLGYMIVIITLWERCWDLFNLRSPVTLSIYAT